MRWSAPTSSSRSLPFDSNAIAPSDMPSQITSMIAATARPCRLSPIIRPYVNASANGTRRMA